MIVWAMLFLLLGTVAAVAGFGGVAGGIAAKLAFFVCLILFSLTMLAHLANWRPPE